jgi:hypothetical protein
MTSNMSLTRYEAMYARYGQLLETMAHMSTVQVVNTFVTWLGQRSKIRRLDLWLKKDGRSNCFESDVQAGVKMRSLGENSRPIPAKLVGRRM